MSETGRKLDVEDVLSSIRRLVSEEARAPEDAPSDTVDEVDAPEKLVLTPSLRVPGDEDKPAPTSDLEQRISDIEALVADEVQAHAPVAELGEEEDASTAAMFAQLGDKMAEPTSSEPLETPEEANEDLGVLEVSSLDMPEEDFTEKLRAFNANSAPTEPEVVQPSDADAAAEVDTPEYQAFRPLGPAEPETTAPPVDVEVMEDLEPAVEREAEAADNFPTDSPFEADLTAEPAPEPDFAAAEPELESVVEPETEPAFEPKAEPPLRAPVIERPEIVDEAEEPTLASAQPEEPQLRASSFDEEIDFTADESGNLIDEDMLREIVSDMVRSELQGELGDRITRNVRKLVRREIHRALASRDFE